jgi:cytochrome c-type biogenesis protein CcmH/NrfF
MQPPFQTDTLLLWLAPVALLLAGAWGWFAYLGPAARRNLEPSPLSDDEATELSKTLGKGGTP